MKIIITVPAGSIINQGNDTELLTILVTLQRTMMQRPYGRIRLINSIIKSKFMRKRTLHRSSKS